MLSQQFQVLHPLLGQLAAFPQHRALHTPKGAAGNCGQCSLWESLGAGWCGWVQWMHKQYYKVFSHWMALSVAYCVFSEQIKQIHAHYGHLCLCIEGKCYTTPMTAWRNKGQEHKGKAKLLCCNSCWIEECFNHCSHLVLPTGQKNKAPYLMP